MKTDQIPLMNAALRIVLKRLHPRWPLQIPPLVAGQTPPGRTGKLSVISAGARKARVFHQGPQCATHRLQHDRL